MQSVPPIELIIAHCEGSISESDERSLRAWRESHPDHEQFFRSFESIWKVTQSNSSSFQPQVETALTKVHRRMGRRLFIKHLSQVAAVILVLLGSWSVFHYMIPESNYQQFVAGHQQTLYLPDSTKVILAEGARLTYPETFSKGKRQVQLSGKAYFDVRHNAEQPFVITTQQAQTEVLGTRFTLIANPDGKEAVFLDEGSIAYSSKDWFGEKVILEPGQKATLKEGSITKVQQPHLNASSWATHQLRFKDTPLRVLIKELQEHYGVTIQLQPDRIGHLRFTGKLSQATAQEALRVVALTLKLKLIQDNQTLILTL